MGNIELEAEVTYNKNYFSETNVTVNGDKKDEVAYRAWSAQIRNDLTVVSKPNIRKFKTSLHLGTSVCETFQTWGFYNNDKFVTFNRQSIIDDRQRVYATNLGVDKNTSATASFTYYSAVENLHYMLKMHKRGLFLSPTNKYTDFGVTDA